MLWIAFAAVYILGNAAAVVFCVISKRGDRLVAEAAEQYRAALALQ